MKKLVHVIVSCIFVTQVNAQYQKGEVMEGGEWHVPTTGKALELMMLDIDDGGTGEPAEAVLRQVFETMPAAELDAFAEELGRIVRDGAKHQSNRASMVLIMASKDLPRGTSYSKSAEIFISVYESFEDRMHPRATESLHGVYSSGGEDYVRDLFNASKKPPECQNCGGGTSRSCESVENPCPNVGIWCQSGQVLVYADEHPSKDKWHRLCRVHRY